MSNPPPPQRPTAPTIIWLCFLLVLAFSPDAKLHRLKLVHLEWTLLAVLLTWAWSGIKEGWVLRRTSLDLPILCLALASTSFYIATPEKSVAGLEFHRILLGCFAFYIASAAVPDRPLFQWTWSFLASLLSANAIWSHLSHAETSRAMATFGNPILFAAFLVPAIVLTAGLIATQPDRRLLTGTLLLLQVAGLAASGTRAAFLALAVTALVALWTYAGGKLAKLAASALLLGAAVGALFLFSRPVTHTLIWRDTLRLWLDHPIFGVGLGRFHLEFPAYASSALKALWPQSEVVVNHAHNEYLQLLAETGLLGAGLLAWILMTFSRTGSRSVFFWAASALWLQAFASPDMRFGVSYACVFVLMALAMPATAERRFQPGQAARGLLAASVTALALWTAARIPEGALAAQALEEPSFFGDSPKVDAELSRWLDEAAARPQDPLVYENLGYYFAKKSDFAAAIAAFQRSIALDPKRPGPHNNLANLLYLQGKAEPALAAWEEALRRDPSLIDAHMNLAIVYYSKGNLKESTHHLETILKLDPKNEKAKALLRRMAE